MMLITAIIAVTDYYSTNRFQTLNRCVGALRAFSLVLVYFLSIKSGFYRGPASLGHFHFTKLEVAS